MVLQAENLDKKIKLYMIYYDNSVERSTFNAMVERETEVFSNLIENKGRITIPFDIGDQSNPTLLQAHPIGWSPRRRSFSLTKDKRYNVIIDMREFMSKLPAVLHRAGFKIFPVQLEVPQRCVEHLCTGF